MTSGVKRSTVVMGQSTRASDVFPLVEKHRVTLVHVVPALLITWIKCLGAQC